MTIVYVVIFLSIVIFLFVMAMTFTTPPIDGKSMKDFPSHIVSAAYRWINVKDPIPSYLGGKPDQLVSIEKHLQTKRDSLHTLKNIELRECTSLYLDYLQGRWLEKHREELTNRTSYNELKRYKEDRKIEEAKIKTILKEEEFTENPYRRLY